MIEAPIYEATTPVAANNDIYEHEDAPANVANVEISEEVGRRRPLRNLNDALLARPDMKRLFEKIVGYK
jgi:hypothetical protein